MTMYFTTMQFKYLIPLAMAIALTGCGGSGGSSNSSSSTTQANISVPMQQALANVTQNGLTGSFNVTGWINETVGTSNPQPNVPLTGSGNFTIEPGQSVTISGGTYNGQAAIEQNIVMSGTLISGSNSAPFTLQSTTYVNPTTFADFETTNSNGTFDFPSYTLPTSVTAGNVGTIGVASGSAGTISETYSVAANDNTTLLVTFSSSTYQLQTGVLTDQTQVTYQIDTQGNVAIAQMTDNAYCQGQICQSLTYTF